MDPIDSQHFTMEYRSENVVFILMTTLQSISFPDPTKPVGPVPTSFPNLIVKNLEDHSCFLIFSIFTKKF